VLDIFINLSRVRKQIILLCVDSVIIMSALVASFSLRLGGFYLPEGELFWLVLGAPIIAIPIFVRFGLYRAIVRYIGLRALWAITQAVTLYALLWGLAVFMISLDGMPRSVIVINWLLVISAIGGSRIFGRWLLLGSENRKNNNECRNVVIYGAGSAGRQLLIALIQSVEYNPVAFIDDNPELHRQSINGIIISSRADLTRLIKKNNVTEVLLATPSLSREQRREIINYLEPYSVLVRALPSVSELAQGKVKINDLLEINLRDLLGREPVKPNAKLLSLSVSKKVVLVTGAGGSIGAELCRQIVRQKPEKLILFDISESALYLIEQELVELSIPGIEVFAVIGSVTDKKRVSSIFKAYGVQTVYHAAAYKHVTLVESNASQGVLNNSLGTTIAAQAAASLNVETFVLISTDKAVRPTSVMGASKRVAELALQALNQEHPGTRFTMVRFGNVLDSSGSVIPLFKKQIKAGGPVTVTHIDVVRYFMTIPEAVELVIQAGAMAEGGEVFVLDMGEPIRIYDLAMKMIRLSGLVMRDKDNAEGDIEIKYTGLKPGEKLYEELLVDGSFTITDHQLIMRAEEGMINWDQLEPILDQIKEAAIDSEMDKMFELIKQLVPQFDHS
jgi:UDP-N-acetylglucosamine 4,6-dehydratase